MVTEIVLFVSANTKHETWPYPKYDIETQLLQLADHKKTAEKVPKR